MATLRCFCNSCKSATKVKGNSTISLFATLNQFLANQPKSFSNCAEAMDTDDWLVDINKHFECSNVRPEDYVKFASFQLKDQLLIGINNTKIPEEVE